MTMTDTPPPATLDTRLEGPAPAMEIALDIVRRGAWMIPVALIAGAAFAGVPGAVSSGYALGIVLFNFLLSAWLLQVTGRISVVMMAGSALFGYLLRLAMIFLAVFLVKDTSWVRFVPLGVTLIVAHLGLLFWELRYVSGSFAYPGLRPATMAPATPGGTRAPDSPEISETSNEH